LVLDDLQNSITEYRHIVPTYVQIGQIIDLYMVSLSDRESLDRVVLGEVNSFILFVSSRIDIYLVKKNFKKLL